MAIWTNAGTVLAPVRVKVLAVTHPCAYIALLGRMRLRWDARCEWCVRELDASISHVMSGRAMPSSQITSMDHF